MEITDFSSLRRGVGLVNALSLWLMSRWPAWLIQPVFETSVARDTVAEVVHTTAIRWWRLPLVRSREVLTLNADGRRLELCGDSRFLLVPWKVERLVGAGEVNESGTCAVYQLEFMGARMQQTAERSSDRVTLTQEMAGYRAVQPLQRR